MNTNFFNQIQALEFTGVLQLNISKGVENNLIVSVLLNNEQCGDNAKNLIPPLTFNATAEEFDKGFFEQITTPVKAVSGLMVDMEKFLKQMEEVKRNSAMEKEKGEKEKKEKETKDKKYKEAMAKADELEKEGKFREAWMKLPKPLDFQEFAETIRKRQTELSNKFSAPSLFGAMEETKPEPTQSEEVKENYSTDETGGSEEVSEY